MLGICCRGEEREGFLGLNVCLGFIILCGVELIHILSYKFNIGSVYGRVSKSGKIEILSYCTWIESARKRGRCERERER